MKFHLTFARQARKKHHTNTMKTTTKILMLAGLLASVAYAVGTTGKTCADCALMPIADAPAKPVEPAKPATPAPPVPTKKPYPLATCVVSGEKLGEMGKPFVFDQNGVEVQLCCKSCKKDFLKDPAKFLKMIEEAEKKTVPAKPTEPTKPTK